MHERDVQTSMTPNASAPPRLTDLIQLAADGAGDAREQLYAIVYDDLRADAHRVLRRQRDAGQLQTTALVHEVVLRFEKGDALGSVSCRRVFFSVAIRAMHQVLVDHYRSRAKLVDSPDRRASSLDAAVCWIEDEVGYDFESLHEQLSRLAGESPRQHAVVMHRFFGGLTIHQTAQLLGVAEQTVERDWRLARAKLKQRLSVGDR